MSKTITQLKAREILDSRGNPTVEVDLTIGTNTATASVPSGASTGRHEACELRDGDAKRFQGLGVLQAVDHVNSDIHRAVVGQAFDQAGLDQTLIELDGTENKNRLGANAMLGVSLAFARAQALNQGRELYRYLGDLAGTVAVALPQPLFNIINGGKHADSGLDLQEFMLIPRDFPSFREKVRAGAEIFHTLKDILHQKNYAIGVGDEGGFAPHLSSNEEALDLMVQAVKDGGYTLNQVQFGLDTAATSFFKHGRYLLTKSGSQHTLSAEALISWYKELVTNYPIILLEDGLAEDAWTGFHSLMRQLGDHLLIVGDDLTVTNTDRIRVAKEEGAINAVLIKLNQIGTVTETLEAIKLTKQEGWAPIISHRSGETTDTFIADLAVGVAAPFIKAGSLSRGERIAKYNRLLVIEQQLEAA